MPTVYIDADEVIDDLSDDDLIDACQRRGIACGDMAGIPMSELRERLETIIHEIKMGRTSYALHLIQTIADEALNIERAISDEQFKRLYAQSLKSAKPETSRAPVSGGQ